MCTFIRTGPPMSSDHMALVGSYNYRLVTLSVVIAIFASYAALDLAGRVTAARGRVRAAWLMGGASAMGLGIWFKIYLARGPVQEFAPRNHTQVWSHRSAIQEQYW